MGDKIKIKVGDLEVVKSFEEFELLHIKPLYKRIEKGESMRSEMSSGEIAGLEKLKDEAKAWEQMNHHHCKLILTHSMMIAGLDDVVSKLDKYLVNNDGEINAKLMPTQINIFGECLTRLKTMNGFYGPSVKMDKLEKLIVGLDLKVNSIES